MICQGCAKTRQTLKVVNSKVMPGSTWNLCEDCKSQGIEPRWAIVLAARSFGIDAVVDYIKGRKYHGTEIEMREVVL